MSSERKPDGITRREMMGSASLAALGTSMLTASARVRRRRRITKLVRILESMSRCKISSSTSKRPRAG